MPYCAVNECKTGSSRHRVKGHFFRVPQNLVALKQWQDATRRADLNPKHSVCHKHFLPHEILKEKIFRGPNGEIVGVGQYAVLRLAKNAVPSIFSWTTPSSAEPAPCQISQITPSASSLSPEKSPSNPVQQGAECSLKTTPRKKGTTDNPTPQKSSHQTIHNNDKHLLQASVKLEEEIEITDTSSKPISFDTVATELHLPAEWTAIYHRDRERAKDIFVLEHRKFRQKDPFYKMYTQKEIFVTPDMTLQINILGVKIDPSVLNIMTDRIDSVETFHDIITKVNKAMICKGARQPEESIPNDCKTLIKDVADCHRSIHCPLIITKSRVCEFCHKTRKIILTKLWRLQKNIDLKKCYPILPNRENQSILVKLKLRGALRRIRYFKSRIECLKAQLAERGPKMTLGERKKKEDSNDDGDFVICEMLDCDS